MEVDIACNVANILCGYNVNLCLKDSNNNTHYLTLEEAVKILKKLKNNINNRKINAEINITNIDYIKLNMNNNSLMITVKLKVFDDGLNKEHLENVNIYLSGKLIDVNIE